MRISLVKDFLEHRERPTFAAARFFAGVIVTVYAVRKRCVTPEQSGIDNALVAIYLNMVVHTAVTPRSA